MQKLNPQCIYIEYSNPKKSSNKSKKYKNKFQTRINYAKCDHIIKGFTSDFEQELSKAAIELIQMGKYVRGWHWGVL